MPSVSIAMPDLPAFSMVDPLRIPYPKSDDPRRSGRSLVENFLRAKVKIELSQKNLPTLKAPATGQPFVWDAHVKGRGLGVRIASDGSKVFYFKYRYHGAQRWLRLGDYGPMTLDQARALVLRHKAALLEDRDPGDAHVGVHKGMTLAEAWEAYVQDKTTVGGNFRTWKPKTLSENQLAFRNYIGPELGGRGILSIRPDDLRKFRDRIASGELSADSKLGRPERKNANRDQSADRVIAYLSGLFSWAIQVGVYKRDNPAAAIGKLVKPEDSVRDRVLASKELDRYLDALTSLEIGDEKNLPANPYAIAALRLYLATGCRREELLQLRWDNVDADYRRFMIVNGKTGNRSVHIHEGASEIFRQLRAIPHVGDNPYVFVGEKPGSHIVNVKATHLKALDRAGIKDVTIHDLRRTYGTISLEADVDIFVLSKSLGHASVTTTQKAYAFIPDSKKIAHNNAVGDRLFSRPKRALEAPKVIPIARKA